MHLESCFLFYLWRGQVAEKDIRTREKGPRELGSWNIEAKQRTHEKGSGGRWAKTSLSLS